MKSKLYKAGLIRWKRSKAWRWLILL